jgi:cellulose 1,4-beta-cellobiosidase
MVVAGLRVEAHHAEDGSATNNEIKPVLRVVNSGSSPIALRDLTLRYYFTSEGAAPSQSVCYWAAVGCNNLVH